MNHQELCKKSKILILILVISQTTHVFEIVGQNLCNSVEINFAIFRSASVSMSILLYLSMT